MDRCAEIYDRLTHEGLSAALEFIADRQSEELFLEFKRSSDKPNRNCRRLIETTSPKRFPDSPTPLVA